MKYLNAQMILPEALVKELQTYVQGGYIYVPVEQEQQKRWGEVSGYRQELEKRNRQIAEEYRKKYGDKVRMAVSGDTWLDIIPLEANKGLAVKELQESLNIRPEETIAFGDQLNDLEMLGRAYYSYAVGNAREEVKKAARFQADRNDRNGVLKVLKEILA